jgi:hypothetical protein
VVSEADERAGKRHDHARRTKTVGPGKLLYQIANKDFSDTRNRVLSEVYRNACGAQRTRNGLPGL